MLETIDDENQSVEEISIVGHSRSIVVEIIGEENCRVFRYMDGDRDCQW